MAFVLTALAGCAPPPPDVAIDEKLATVAHVSFHGQGRGVVRYLVDGEEQSTPVEATSSVDHDIAVVGLHPGTATITAALVDDGGAEHALPPVDVQIKGFTPIMPIVNVQGETDGFVLTHGLSDDQPEGLLILDGHGAVAWQYPVDPGLRITNVEETPDGSVWFTAVPLAGVGGVVHHITLDGALDEEIALPDLAGAAVPTTDGLVYLARRIGPWHGDDIVWDAVVERAADGTTRTIFDFREAIEPTEVCYHQRIVVDDHGYFDWTHANSLLLSDDGRTVYVMSRHLDGLFAIDRASGEIVWVFGGPHGTFDLGAVPTPEHAHTTWLRDGVLWVMDNGNHRGFSRVVGYDLHEATGTASLLGFRDEPDQAVVEYLGDVKPVGDDLLVSWTTRGRLQRLGPDGASIFSVDTGLGVAPGRALWLPDLYPP